MANVMEGLRFQASEAVEIAEAEIIAHGLRDPWKLVRQAIELSQSLLGLIDRNPDAEVVKSYSANIAALHLQIAVIAEEKFLSQTTLFEKQKTQVFEFDFSQGEAA